MIEFKAVNFPVDLEISTKIIRDAFITVADEFNLNTDNCPTNPAFIEPVILESLLTDFRELYLLCYGKTPVGFVGIEQSPSEERIFFIEKVAVIPEFRHRGLGREIMKFAQNRILEMGGRQASIAIIHENLRLRAWYKTMGFEETGVKKFNHLPFEVCFMAKELR